MSMNFFYVVTLSHQTWAEALAYARQLPEDAIPEIRLDIFTSESPRAMVEDVSRRCIVSCRRKKEGGFWDDEGDTERERALGMAYEARPEWLDWDWDSPLPAWHQIGNPTKILRSLHALPKVFDIAKRLKSLPEGDAFKWVGHAQNLSDNATLRRALESLNPDAPPMSLFLRGAKGLPSRILQKKWGGSFTYAGPDDAPAALKDQLSVGQLRRYRAHLLNPETLLAGLIGSPILHSRGFDFHCSVFEAQHKNAVYVPLETEDPQEARMAIESLEIQGFSITTPLKKTLSNAMGSPEVANTFWKRTSGEIWKHLNTDGLAFEDYLKQLTDGPVLILGDGVIAQMCQTILEHHGRKSFLHSRKSPLSLEMLRQKSFVGIIQATSLGMKSRDPLPFPEVLNVIGSNLKWAMEWVYKERTIFEQWATQLGLNVISGEQLFLLQAKLQSKAFLQMQYTKGVRITSFGTLLNQSRLTSGLSLERLAEALNLPVALLTQMEEDQWHALPSGRAKPLARQVAEYLGFRPEDHPDSFNILSSYIDNDGTEKQELPSASLRLKQGGFVILVGIILYVLLVPRTLYTPPSIDPPVISSGPTLEQAPTPQVSYDALGQYVGQDQSQQTLTLLFETIQPTKIELKIARPQKIEIFDLSSAASQIYSVSSEFSIKCSDAYLLRIKLNGVPLNLPTVSSPTEFFFDRRGQLIRVKSDQN